MLLSTQIRMKLKVMADYHCYPLWLVDQNGPKNISPESLLLDTKIIQQLYEWADKYDSTLNLDDPRNSGFPSPQAHRAFVDSGLQIAKELAKYTNATWAITYFDDISRQEIMLVSGINAEA